MSYGDFDFGDIVMVSFGIDESYIGVVFGSPDKYLVGYEDGKVDTLELLLDCVSCEMCTISKVTN